MMLWIGVSLLILWMLGRLFVIPWDAKRRAAKQITLCGMIDTYSEDVQIKCQEPSIAVTEDVVEVCVKHATGALDEGFDIVYYQKGDSEEQRSEKRKAAKRLGLRKYALGTK